MLSFLMKGHKAREPEQRAVTTSGDRVYLTLTDSVFLELSVGSQCAQGEELLFRGHSSSAGNSVGMLLLWGGLQPAGA